MCSAVSRRMRDHGSTRSPSQGSAAGWRDGRAGWRAGGRGSGAGECAGAGGCRRKLPAGPPARLPAFDVADDVVLRHPARDAAARNRGDVEVVLRRHLPHQRRGPAAEPVLGGLRAVARGCGGERSRRTRRRRRPRARTPGRTGAAAAGAVAGGGAAGAGAGRGASAQREPARVGAAAGGRAGLGLDPRHHRLHRDRLLLPAPGSRPASRRSVRGSPRRPCRWRSRTSARRASPDRPPS